MTAPRTPDELARLVAEATPGPWEAANTAGSSQTPAEYLADTLIAGDEPLWLAIAPSPKPEFAYIVPAVTGDGPTSAANAALIVALRNDAPRLVAALRVAEARVAFVDALNRGPVVVPLADAVTDAEAAYRAVVS